MSNPISSPDALQNIVQSFKSKGKFTLPPQPIDPDDAAVQCLCLLTDPDGVVLPAEAFRELEKRNAALLTATAAEIKESLARQVMLLEAAATRFLTKAATTTNTTHSCALMKISLSAQRSLVATLGALHQMTEKDIHVIDA